NALHPMLHGPALLARSLPSGAVRLVMCGIRLVEGNPTFGPAADLAKSALKLASLGGEVVFDAHRAFRNDLTRNQVLGLERAKAFGEHAIGDVWNRGFDHRVASAALQQSLQNSAGPAAADELDSAVESRTDVLGCLGRRVI